MDGAGIVDMAILLGGVGYVTYLLLKPTSKLNATKRALYLISIYSNIAIVLIPTIGHRVDRYGHHNFGFLGDIASYRGNTFSVDWLLFVFSIFVFYWILRLLVWMWNSCFKKLENYKQ